MTPRTPRSLPIQHAPATDAPAFTQLTDLAAERLGGKALLASDDFFAEKENLLRPGRGVFLPDQFTERGKWMDGWETRRRRTPGHDWCVVRLGCAGVIRGCVVDTNHFDGNQPEFCSVEACVADDDAHVLELAETDDASWQTIVPKSPCAASSEHFFEVENEHRFTHVRLNIFPDGGVARLRLHGEPRPDWQQIKREGEPVDLASVQLGALVLATSDMHFSSRDNLIMPGESINMGDGWETRRRRTPGHDWLVLRLATRGTIERIVVDTSHFKGNYPDSCSLESCDLAPEQAADIDFSTALAVPWRELVAQSKLEADTRHEFGAAHAEASTHVRLRIYPDGGVARLRLIGTPA